MHLSKTSQQIEDFCAKVKEATNHECRPYRAGVFCIHGRDNGRMVTFSCRDMGGNFHTILEREIKPAMVALYQ